jgi:hypothetical protein
MITHAPPLLIAIQWWGYVGWQLNFFGWKKGRGACNINFEKQSSPHALFQSLFNGGGVSNGYQKI